MALIPSTETPIGTPAPAFSLPEPASGNHVALSDYSDKPVVVIFMCNHCPYVIHILDGLVAAGQQLIDQGIAVVAISANDASNYPADGPEKMAALSRDAGLPFPYLYDETQQTAKAYNAQCTPDLYLFDKNHALFYRGQFDSSRPGSGQPVTGEDLLNAASDMLAGNAPPASPTPSVGCSIKWK